MSSIHLVKRAVINSTADVAEILEHFGGYRQKVVYTQEDNELYDVCTADERRLSSCLTQIKAARDTLQTKATFLEDICSSTKSRTELKELNAEIDELDKETQYYKLLRDSSAFVRILESNLLDTRIELEKVQRKLKISCEASTSYDSRQGNREDTSSENPSIDGPLITAARYRAIKAPTITLPKFYGVQEEFPEFWAIFETLVHNNDEISEIEKVVLLKESLKGAAEKIIKGIQPIPKNYGWMTETLRKRYGNKPANKSKIVQKLFDLKAATKEAESCQECFDAIKTLVNQMVSAGYDIRRTSDPMWSEAILSKFPYGIVEDILVKHQETDTMEIETLLEALDKEISAKAYVQSRLGTRYPCRNSGFKAESSSHKRGCVFCKKTNHPSHLCRTVTDRQRRRDILKEMRCCWKCFDNSHSSSDCSNPNCTNCEGLHHHSVCGRTERFGSINSRDNPPLTSNRWARNENAIGSVPNRSFPRPNPAANRNTANMERDARFGYSSLEQPLSSNQNIENHFVQASCTQNEQLVLMTAEGNVWNQRTNTLEKVLFFFDTGAQKTVIEEALAERLGLPKLTTETCVMSGIGGHTEKFVSHLVTLKICSAHGQELNTTIKTKPIITGEFPSLNLIEIDAEFLQDREIFIANSKIRGERQVPQILVGLDYYYDLVRSNVITSQTPSGLHIAKTIFGPTLYGRGTINTNDTGNLSYSMTSIYEVPNHYEERSRKTSEQERLGTKSVGNKPEENTMISRCATKKMACVNKRTVASCPTNVPPRDRQVYLRDNYGPLDVIQGSDTAAVIRPSGRSCPRDMHWVIENDAPTASAPQKAEQRTVRIQPSIIMGNAATIHSKNDRKLSSAAKDHLPKEALDSLKGRSPLPWLEKLMPFINHCPAESGDIPGK